MTFAEVKAYYEEKFGEEYPHDGDTLANSLNAGLRILSAYVGKPIDLENETHIEALVWWMYESRHPYKQEKVGDYFYMKGDNTPMWKQILDGEKDWGW